MPIDSETGEYTLPEPTQEELDALASQLVILDPERKGIEMKELRTFYPKLGWSHIQKRLEALETAGRVSRKKRRPAGAAVSFEYWIRAATE